VTLPEPGAYREAIQNPKSCFKDPELKDGTFETDKLGLPRVISGQNALVFKITSPAKKVYAVRCFLRYDPDQKERYQKISDYLEKRNQKYTVGFKFIEQGIKVQNSWYPILKMDWVYGVPLDDYLNKNYNNPQQILDLTYRFLEMLIAIRKENIAHCDLQHGNILVVGNELKLVDYDGMYIPDFAGKKSLEFGHPNYQHPSRVFQRFDRNMDNFSAWVIFSSLAVIAADPNIWKTSDYDNQLLFNGKDFLYPDDSPILKILKNNPHPTIVKFGKLMNSLLISPELLPSPVDYSLPHFISDISWIDQYVESLLDLNSYTHVRDTTAEAVEPPRYVAYIRKGKTLLKPWYMERYEEVETSVPIETKLNKKSVHGGCSFPNCGKHEYLLWKCNYCGGLFCGDHRMPFDHNCPGIDRYNKRSAP
jgi:serine/threonine protein kinase